MYLWVTLSVLIPCSASFLNKPWCGSKLILQFQIKPSHLGNELSYNCCVGGNKWRLISPYPASSFTSCYKGPRRVSWLNTGKSVCHITFFMLSVVTNLRINEVGGLLVPPSSIVLLWQCSKTQYSSSHLLGFSFTP